MQQKSYKSLQFRPALLLALISLLSWLVLVPLSEAKAQNVTPSVQFSDFATQVRFKVGIKFSVKAKATNARIENLEIKIKFGRRGVERTFPVGFQANTSVDAAFALSRDDDDSLAAGMPLLYTWTAGVSGGSKISSQQNTVYYEDNRFRWNQIEGKLVTLRWYKGDGGYGNLMFNLSADSLATYQRRFNMITTRQIYISIYGSQTDFFNAYDGEVPTWAGGLAFPEIGEISLIAPQDEMASQYIGYGIPHELAHAALYQFVGHAVPHWLDEGFAVYNQNQISPEYAKLVREAANNGRLLSFDSISRAFPADASMAKLAYAQSRSIVDFLIGKFGDAPWSNLLDQLRTKNVDEAVSATYGVDFATLQYLWKSYITGVAVTLPKPKLAGPVSAYPVDPPSSLTDQLAASPAIILMFGLATVGVLGLLFFWFIIFPRRKQAKIQNQAYDPFLHAYFQQPDFQAGTNSTLVTPPPGQSPPPGPAYYYENPNRRP